MKSSELEMGTSWGAVTTLLLESERGMDRSQLPGLTSSISCANSSLHKNVGFQSSLISLAADWTEISANRKVSIIIIKSEFWWGWIYGSETKDVWLHGHDYWILDFSNLPLCFQEQNGRHDDGTGNFFFFFFLNIPWCVFRNWMADLRTVDLSIFLLLAATMLQSSLMRRLNWSRRFFSLRLRVFLLTHTHVYKLSSCWGYEFSCLHTHTHSLTHMHTCMHTHTHTNTLSSSC